MVFGQTRQEDLVAYILQQVPEEQRTRVCGQLAMDLSPPLQTQKQSAKLA